jgi:4-amino-4-deoxy-L-arabinose transferase-like glycosyltransferase
MAEKSSLRFSIVKIWQTQRVKRSIIFIAILVLGFLLRFAFLSKIPPELNRDEVSVGFNAFSLLKTGKDEYGHGPWPLVFRAFGDNKIPGYIYLMAPLIKIFGLNGFTVRLPAAFFGWLTIIVGYFLIRELFSRRENLALIFSFLLATAPFHLHYSRQQFETTVALFFTLTGLIFLLKARRKISFLFLALPFFAISFFIYNTPLFIIPPLLFFTFWLYKKEYFNDVKKRLLVFIFIIFLALGWLSYWQLVKEGNQGRAETTIFNHEELKKRISNNIFWLNKKGIPVLIGKAFYNQPILLFKDFAKNYLAAFNPQFIFFTGDNNPWHSLGYLNFGNLFIILSPFILLGFLGIVKNLKRKENLFVLIYLLVSPLGNGLTTDSPILTRLLNFHLVLIILAALGLVEFWEWKLERCPWKNILLTFFLAFSIANYLLTYFIIFPQTQDRFWLPGIKEVCQQIKAEEKDYDLVIFDPHVEVAYIFLAFYLPFEPVDFQTRAERTLDGLDRAIVYDKYRFNENLAEWKHPDTLRNKVSGGKKMLLVEKVLPGDRPRKEGNNFLIYNFWGEPIWQLTRVTN